MASFTCRWDHAGAVGGRYRVNIANLRQRLRLLHHDRLSPLLADGLQQHPRGNTNGHRALQGSHPRTFYVQVCGLLQETPAGGSTIESLLYDRRQRGKNFGVSGAVRRGELTENSFPHFLIRRNIE